MDLLQRLNPAEWDAIFVFLLCPLIFICTVISVLYGAAEDKER